MKVIPTGIERLDIALKGGLREDTFTVIASRPGVGKSSLALQMAGNMASHGCRVLFFSFEMTVTQINERLHLQNTSIPNGFFVIEDRPGTEIGIEQVSETLKQYKDSDIVFIDYLQLFDYNRNCYDKVTALKDLSLETGVPIVLTSQLRRRDNSFDTDTWVPDLSDVRKTGSLEQNANVIILPYRKGYHTQHSSANDHDGLIIAKNTYGETGFVDLMWDNTKRMFVAVSPSTVTIPGS